MNTRYLGILGCFYLTACTHQLPLTTANSIELESTQTAEFDHAYAVPRLVQFGDLAALNHYLARYQQQTGLQSYVRQVKLAREQRCAREIGRFSRASFAEQAQYREACPAWLLQPPSVNYVAAKPPKTAPTYTPPKFSPQTVVHLPPAQQRPPAQIIIANAPPSSNTPQKTAPAAQTNIMPIVEEKLPPLLDLLSNLNRSRSSQQRRRYSR